MVEEKGIDIMVGTPLHRNEGSFQFRECMDACMDYTHKKGFTLAQCWSHGSLLTSNRNRIVEEAIKANAKYVMMFDDDQIFEKDIIVRMLKRQKPIISALYFRKTYPYMPIMMKGAYNHKLIQMTEWEKGALIEVDSCGGGGLLVNMKVFDNIPKPWFCIPPLFLYFDGKSRKYKISAEIINDKERDGNDMTGEDVWFCHIAKESGFPIYVDTDCIMGHLGSHPFGPDEYYIAKEEMKCKNEQS